MADELQVISNPDSVPGPAVSTSYQQQNVIAEAMRNGFDGTAPVSATSTTITVPIGGPVDVNSILYALASAATLTISLVDTDYYIYLEAGSTVDYLTPKLTTNAGTFDASKNARYTASGERILNWVVRRDSSASYVYKMLDVQNVLVLSNQGLRTGDNVTFADITGDEITGDNGTFSGEVFAPITRGNSVIANSSLSALGISTFTGAVFANSNLSVAGDFTPQTSPTASSISVPAGGSSVLANGSYDISLTNSPVSGSLIIEQTIGTFWRTLAQRTSTGSSIDSYGGFYWSAGALRIRNTGASTVVVYYNKF